MWNRFISNMGIFRISTLTVIASALLLAACQTTANLKDCKPDGLNRIVGAGECLQIKTFGVKIGNSGKPLVVLIHGDGSRGGPSDYLRGSANQIVSHGAIAVVLIRPGYYDSSGNHSTGNSYRFKGDGYRQHIIDAVGGAVAGLKSFHGSTKVILVGHSGGAAISGVLMGQKPSLADAAVLAACPCNVTAWRRQKNRRLWPHSRSPHNYIKSISKNAAITVLTGSQDTNAKPNLSENYVKELKRLGRNAKFILVKSASHNSVVHSQAFIDSILEYL